MYITKRELKLFNEVTEEEKTGYVVTVHTHKGESIILKVIDDDTNEILQKERIATT